ncbi:MAG TPA: ectoine/hydroxyectoine ABC transporter permease subunit EhuC [Stellaceae bacterium]|nr:ectoine/hydroxyectoine ABC transporter permease subunit EhuC [Stellaceae bacterium]
MDLSPDAWLLLARGIVVTIELTVASAILGLLTAFGAGLAQLSSFKAIRSAATLYIEFWRGASALVQLFVAFYVLPVLGISLPPFLVATLVLGLNVGGYGSQVVRAAVQSIGCGQSEAAASLGLSRVQAMRLVILPQAIRLMLPTFGNEAVELLKLTAIASLITLQDLSLAAREIAEREGHAALVYALELAIYFVLGLPLMRLTNRLEARLAPRDRDRAAGTVAGTP